MNWKTFAKSLAHAALGGISVALAQAAANPQAPITTETLVLPALASAATSVLSLLAQSPVEKKDGQ